LKGLVPYDFSFDVSEHEAPKESDERIQDPLLLCLFVFLALGVRAIAPGPRFLLARVDWFYLV